MPMACQPRRIAAFATARMTAFKPGQSPPPVTTPIVGVMEHRSVEFACYYEFSKGRQASCNRTVSLPHLSVFLWPPVTFASHCPPASNLRLIAAPAAMNGGPPSIKHSPIDLKITHHEVHGRIPDQAWRKESCNRDL